MSRKALRTYLNDHLAGSVAALELLDHLADLHPDPVGQHQRVEVQRLQSARAALAVES